MPVGVTVGNLLEMIAAEVRDANSSTASVLLSNVQVYIRNIQKYADISNDHFNVVRDLETKIHTFAVGLRQFGDVKSFNNSPVEIFRRDAFDAVERFGVVLANATPSETARALGVN